MPADNRVALRAPDPLRYQTAKIENNGRLKGCACRSTGYLTYIIGQFQAFWSRLVRVQSIHLDQKTRVSIDLVQVVQVVQAKSHIMHMRARAYVSLFFLHIILILRLKFEFVRNHLDHLDQASHSAALRLDHPLGPTWTTWTTSMTVRLSGFLKECCGVKHHKNSQKWSREAFLQASWNLVSGGN